MRTVDLCRQLKRQKVSFLPVCHRRASRDSQRRLQNRTDYSAESEHETERDNEGRGFSSHATRTTREDTAEPKTNAIHRRDECPKVPVW